MSRWKRLSAVVLALCVAVVLPSTAVVRGEYDAAAGIELQSPAVESRSGCFSHGGLLPPTGTASATIYLPGPPVEYPVYLTTAVPRTEWDMLHPALKAVAGAIAYGETLWFVADSSRLSWYETRFDVTNVEEVVAAGVTIGYVVTTYGAPGIWVLAAPAEAADGVSQPEAPEPEPVATPAAVPTPVPVPVPTVAPPATTAAVVTLSLRLERGWNLFSFNILPADCSVESLLSGIDGKYSVVETIDGIALSYRPGSPLEENTLKYLDPFHGYWIKMEEEARLSISGTRVPATTSISLREGPNLVSFLGDSTMRVTEALSAIDGLYTAVLGYEGRAVSFHPGLPADMNTLEYLTPGRGYVIVMSTGATLVYYCIL